MQCLTCQYQNPAQAKFCMNCGSRLELKCPHCGAAFMESAKFCMECGAEVHPQLTDNSRGSKNQPIKQAERRQLTVLFCDLVGSTALSEKLDAEDFRQVILNYQELAEKVVKRFGGHVGNYLGDGLLIYFGYPKGLEDAPGAGIRAGLGILEVVAHANKQWAAERNTTIAVRIGIHTGLVVVDDHLALGETTNIAARLEGMAPENGLVISPQTMKLVEGWFEMRSLGEKVLKGISHPVEIFQVLNESGARSRLDIAMSKGLSPFVGREQEINLLLDRWGQAKEGAGQVVLITGEPGIGKSRLTEVLKIKIAEEPEAWLNECLCSAYHASSAFFPVIDCLERVFLQFAQNETPKTKQDKLEGFLTQQGLPLDTTMPLFAALLSIPLEERYSAPQLSPIALKKKTMDNLLQIFIGITRRQPLLLVVEDLHWADPSTLEWLGLLIEQVPANCLFAVFTARPEFQSPWQSRAYFTQLTLPRLHGQTTEMICKHLCHGKSLPAEVLAQIKSKTDGVPLFVEELTQMVLESGLLRESKNSYELSAPLPPLAIPATLQDSLIARLDRLAEVKDVAQTGAVLGREFSFELLYAVAAIPQEILEKDLAKLVAAELLYQRGLPPHATYIFKHALIQDTAYSSMLKSRRQQLHQRVASVFEKQFPHFIESQPELLAHHLTEAVLAESALPFWVRAGQLAIARNANQEAAQHIQKGLGLIANMPESIELKKIELRLLTLLLVALASVKGYTDPDLAKYANRALDLCKQVEQSAEVFSPLFWLSSYHHSKGDFVRALDLDRQLIQLAEKEKNASCLYLGYLWTSMTQLALGQNREAIESLEKAQLAYDPGDKSFLLSFGHGDWQALVLTFKAAAMHYLGYPAQAIHILEEAIIIARKDKFHYPLFAATSMGSAAVYFERGDFKLIQQVNEPALKLAVDNNEQFWMLNKEIFIYGSLANQGDISACTSLHQAIRKIQQTGFFYHNLFFYSMLVKAYCNLGRTQEGLEVLTEAFEVMKKTGEGNCKSSLFRLKGELLLMNGNSDEEVEQCFQTALQIAREQASRWHELLAAKSLARLLSSQGKFKEAYDLLYSIYNWFTEGFDLVDMQETKALLVELKR